MTSMAQELVIVDCKQCGRDVKLNGIGSSRDKYQRFITRMLGAVIPFTCDKFRPASDWHDMAVHLGCPVDRGFREWFEEVDHVMYEMCHSLAQVDTNWFTRRYYEKQAKDLHFGLLVNDGNGYDTQPCNHRAK